MMLGEPIDELAGDPVEIQLDQDIDDLQYQVRKLKARLAEHTTNILSSPHSLPLLSRLQSIEKDATPLQQTSALQSAHNTTALYRACASITTFRIQDPDPNAVDSGKVFAVRIESFDAANGRYQRPYYVFLNKPYAGADVWRVHRHTLPPCINIQELSKRWLPPPKQGDILKVQKQILGKFVRGLRHEIAGYANRVAAIKAMRKACRLDEKGARTTDSGGQDIRDIVAADAEAKQIRIEWLDGRVGRVVVGRDGRVTKCVVIGEGGVDRRTGRMLLARGGRLVDVARGINEREMRMARSDTILGS